MAALLFYEKLRTEGPVLSVLRLRYRYAQNEREYEVEGPVLIPRPVTLYRAECPVIPTLSLFCHPSVMPDPRLKMSRTDPIGHPASFASANETRKTGRAHRPAPTRKHPDPVEDDLQPALSGAEGCRPVPFQTTKENPKTMDARSSRA